MLNSAKFPANWDELVTLLFTLFLSIPFLSDGTGKKNHKYSRVYEIWQRGGRVRLSFFSLVLVGFMSMVCFLC